MLKFKNIFFILFAVLAIVSCSKENFDDTSTKKDDFVPFERLEQNNLLQRPNAGQSGGGQGLVMGCITISYPFDLVEVDGNTETVYDNDQFFQLLSDSLNFEFVDFVYPLEVTIDGESQSIETSEILGDLFAECIPDEGWTSAGFPAYLIDDENSCFNLIYPINLLSYQDVPVTIGSEDEFVEAITKELYFFTFPMDLLNEDGETVTVSDIDAMYAILYSCGGNDNPTDSTGIDWESDELYIGCYTAALPMSVVNHDGATVVIDSVQQFNHILLSGGIQDFGYPLTLVDSEGEEIVVNNLDELNATIADCPGHNLNVEVKILLNGVMAVDSMGFEPCYTINFPISVEIENDEMGTEIRVINDVDELVALDMAQDVGDVIIVSLVYPISLVLIEDGTVITINDILELLQNLAEKCL